MSPCHAARRKSSALAIALAGLAALRAPTARADGRTAGASGAPIEPMQPPAVPPSAPVGGPDYTTRRYELAAFPRLGGNSDVGFEFGAVGTLSYFANGTRPYAWNTDLAAWISLKGGPTGPEIAQQSLQWNIDVPGLFGGGVRINPQVSWARTIDRSYFGLGNASPGAVPAGASDPGRYFQFVQRMLLVGSTARFEVEGPLSVMTMGEFRFAAPEPYAGSLLAQDAAARTSGGGPRIYGVEPLSLVSAAGGLIYDSRDDEVFTRSGAYDEIGVRLTEGLPFDDRVRYVEVGGTASAFVPIAGPVLFAGRIVADCQFGHVPFYDLFTAGPFQLKELPGGSTGVRGVPAGRYLGPIKVVGNAEFRAMLAHFTWFKQKISYGNDAFFDVGRIWSDYSFRSPLDGSGLGLKFGVGAGMYWMWGQAAMFRIEAAYSPDAVSVNPGFPFGIYVEDGTMF